MTASDLAALPRLIRRIADDLDDRVLGLEHDRPSVGERIRDIAEGDPPNRDAGPVALREALRAGAARALGSEGEP